MPELDFGFDVADPSKWNTVESFSAIRSYRRRVENTYNGGALDFAWDANPNFTFKTGFAYREYGFSTTAVGRDSVRETLNPTLLEAGKTIAEMGTVRSFGAGLDLSGNTPTSFFAPDLDKFRELFDFECNCVNKWNDWRISHKLSFSSTFDILEKDSSYYGQIDFRFPVFGRELRGNVGVRQAHTDLTSHGYTNRGRAITAFNEYDNTLPSINLAYEVAENMLVRFGAAEVMSRPLLGNLAPSVTSFTVPSTPGAISGGTLTIGNPKLAPFTAVNLDLSFEWYFQRGSLFSIAIFNKDIGSFPQTLVGDAILDATAIGELRAEFEGYRQQHDGDRSAADGGPEPDRLHQRRQRLRRASVPGCAGRLYPRRRGQLSAEPDLPALVFREPGRPSQLHPPRVRAELHPHAPAAEDRGWAVHGASPDSFNFTVYYQVPRFSARVSTAYRADYVTTYPIAAGVSDPGFSDAPLLNDFAGSLETFNVDASVTYQLRQNVTLTAEALNLTNQTTNRWSYAEDRVVSNYGSSGRMFFVGARMSF